MKDKIKNGKLLQAASALEKAAAEIESLTNTNKNLEIENARLRLEVVASQRSGRARDLAELMFKKGLISKNDVLTKAEEIMGYNDEAFEVLKETVEKSSDNSDTDSSFHEDVSVVEKEAAALSYNRSAVSKNLVAEKVLSSMK